MEKNGKNSKSGINCDAGKGKPVEDGMEEFDDILEVVGSNGPYQKLLLYGTVIPISFMLALLSHASIFTLFIPDHYCNPGLKMEPAELKIWKLKNIPIEQTMDNEEKFSSCKMYTNETNTTIDCPNGWIYDRIDFDATIPSDFDWVCENDFYATSVFTMSSVGTFIGNIVFGPLADKYGRKPILFICTCLYMIFTLIGLFLAHLHYVFMACTLIASCGFPMVYTVPPLLMAELCDNDYRAWTFTAGWIAWVCGMISLPWIAYFARTWFVIGLGITIPAFLIFFIFLILPESPRWLISTGKVEEAGLILYRIAKMNGTSHKFTNDELLSILHKIAYLEDNKENKTLGFWTLFSSKRLAMITILCTACWTTSFMIYDQITLNSPYMSGNKFLNFFILGVAELPASCLAGYLIRTLGRRWTPVAFGVFMGVVCLIAGVVPPSQSIIVICCIILAKFGVTITCYVVTVQQTELFPTPLRVTASAVASTIGSVFALLNASSVYSGRVYAGAPYLVMFCLSTIGVVCACFLPETLRQHLPETIEDAEDFGKGNKFWSIHPYYDRKLRKSLRRASQVDSIKNFSSTTI